MSRHVARHRLDGVDKGLVSLPARGLAPDGVRAAQVTVAALTRNAIPDEDRGEQHEVLVTVLTALGINPNT